MDLDVLVKSFNFPYIVRCLGYFIRQVQDDDDLFKSIKLNVNEFVGKANVVDKFNIKCRYLRADERIDNKVKKIRKNSNVMILGEMIFVDSEFLIDKYWKFNR